MTETSGQGLRGRAEGQKSTMKNVNENSIASGVPMDLEQMRVYLQGLYGNPVVLREQGTTNISCPYCFKLHEHLQPGHHVALCDESDRYNGCGIVIGNRYFVPNYGYEILEYREADGVNNLIVP